jgi:DNA-binding transcriptional ArsR family regulator
MTSIPVSSITETDKAPIVQRPLLDSGLATGLGELFKVLSSSTRLRLLHALVRQPDLCVGEIAKEIGMSIQSVSNQLQDLLDKEILGSRKNGLKVHYRILDPCVVILLDRGLCLLEDLPLRRVADRGEGSDRESRP